MELEPYSNDSVSAADVTHGLLVPSSRSRQRAKYQVFEGENGPASLGLTGTQRKTNLPEFPPQANVESQASTLDKRNVVAVTLIGHNVLLVLIRLFPRFLYLSIGWVFI